VGWKAEWPLLVGRCAEAEVRPKPAVSTLPSQNFEAGCLYIKGSAACRLTIYSVEISKEG
jgi:hypothetical protein